MPDEPTFIALTPTTRPSRSTSGPPELPGLIAASCCTHLVNRPVRPRSKAISSTSSPPSDVKTRSVLLTMPSVTDRDNAKGEPIAITVSPTTNPSESPKAATGNFSPGSSFEVSMRITARSVSGSSPTMVAGSSRLSASVTRNLRPSLTTCWLVSTYPSSLRMVPLPVEPPLVSLPPQ